MALTVHDNDERLNLICSSIIQGIRFPSVSRSLLYPFAQLFYHYNGNVWTTNMFAFKDKPLNLRNNPCGNAFEFSFFYIYIEREIVVCV